jgi:hypothetical protein
VNDWQSISLMDTITVSSGGIVAAPRRCRASTDKELPGSLQTHEDVCKQSNANIPAPTPLMRPLVPTLGVSAAIIFLRAVDIEAFGSAYLVRAESKSIYHGW